jgi:hypothetical protein
MPEPEAPAITDSITSSLVLAADDPASQARFYGALLKVKPQSGLSSTHWRVPWPAGGWLELYAPSRSRPQPRQPGRLALCLQRKAEAAGPWTIRRGWNHSAPRPGCSTRRATACCC